MEFGKARELLAEPSRRQLGALMRVPRRGRLAIEVVDQPRVERGLLLQVGRDRAPDEAGEASAPARLRGGGVRRDVPRGIERRKL